MSIDSKMDIIKELSEFQTILLIIPSVDYNDDIVDIVKKLSGKKIVYVSLNKTKDSLVELFKKNKIKTENIIFVDAISKTIKNVSEQSEGVYYVSSPGALTEISLVISKIIEHNLDYLIFDSLTNLLVYEKKAPVAKFIARLVNKIKDSKTKAIFYALNVMDHDALIKESGMFVEKVIEI